MLKKYNDIHGILLLNKPKGLSSNIILQQIKEIFFVKKAGFSGCLDPLATGMLPICFGNATKFSKYLTNSIKYYHVIAKLGQVTTTGDVAGKVIKKYKVNVKINNIIQTLKTFHGIIQQVPPMFSAIKYKGKPLYKYARCGINIPRKLRILTIYYINIIQYCHNFLELKIKCSKGTYIRSLIQDIGKNITMWCAHCIFKKIRNGSVCYITINKFFRYFIKKKNNNFLKNYSFFDYSSFILPIRSFFSEYPIIRLSHLESIRFQKKLYVFLSHNFIKNSIFVITNKNNVFLGIGKVNNLGILIPECILKNI
ncbi:tRNA pseudouridine 55 synthetase [Buchnera aphidicola (Cinara tujafilina)]|uniref:tRNA pseudouridine synthase B n=1 Tax=Buchnera aphidicola (Cinara tujafilina) TaxID=261317 RepID=F7WZG3_9GAMM|nr:tRNA pseudouridine(55) synthase TruB [Buchnera aphidicola]AEH39825.1 tRNA pseudouridine 55 synthetase [Buchnera aphidicola (Cinara tujafilina)]